MWADELRQFVEQAKEDNYKWLIGKIYSSAKSGRYKLQVDDLMLYPEDLRNRLHLMGLATELDKEPYGHEECLLVVW